MLFAGAYDHTVENLVRAEQAHYAKALTYREQCTSRVAVPKKPKQAQESNEPSPNAAECANVFGSHSEFEPTKLQNSLLWPLASSRLVSPMPWVVDQLPPLISTVRQASGRYSKRGRLPTEEPSAGDFSWVRGPSELRLTRANMAEGLWGTLLPGFMELEYDWLGIALLKSAAGAALVQEAASGPSTIVVLCSVDPLRKPAFRGIWAAALERFEVQIGRSKVDPRLTAAQPTAPMLMRVWDDCDKDEQRVLTQIAVDSYANPHSSNEPTIEHLIRRGLLDAGTLSVSSDAFAKFMRANASPAQMREWESADGGTAWSMLRVPLCTGVTALLAGLTISRPELAAAGAALPTFAASLPIVIRVLTSVVGAPLPKV